MTPLGHLSISYLSARSIGSASVPAVIIGGIVPDLDFLFIYFDWFNKYHHVTTHNIFYIGIASSIAYLLADKQNKMPVALNSAKIRNFLPLLTILRYIFYNSTKTNKLLQCKNHQQDIRTILTRSLIVTVCRLTEISSE